MMLLADAMSHVLPHRLRAEPLFELPAIAGHGPWPVYLTNQMFMAAVAALVVTTVMLATAARHRRVVAAGGVPGGFTGAVEALVDLLRREVVQPTLGARTARFMPFLLSTFFFILTCNLLGMMPIAEVVELLTGRAHLGGTATGAIYVTGGLALSAFVMIHVSGIKEQYLQHRLGTEEYERRVLGVRGHGHERAGSVSDGPPNGHGHGEESDPQASSRKPQASHGHGHAVRAKDPLSALVLGFLLYWWNFAPHVFPASPAQPGWARALLHAADLLMWVILLVLELLGALIKPFALALRLFANMIAGHIVLASILAMVFAFRSWAVTPAPVLGAVALSFLELFVAFLQAYIFTFLTALFIGAAVAPEH